MRTHVRVMLFSALIVVTGSVSAYAQLPAEDHVVELGVMFWKPSPELILTSQIYDHSARLRSYEIVAGL